MSSISQKVCHLKIFSAILLLFSAVTTKLSILSGRQAIEEMGSGEDYKDIKYSLAAFGTIPYGINLVGFGHFDPENANGCNSGSISHYNDQDLIPFLIVKRGNCKFDLKVSDIFSFDTITVS